MSTPSNGNNQWANVSFGPWKYAVGVGAAALVFFAFGWQLYFTRQDALEAMRQCHEHAERLEKRIDDLILRLREK